MQGPLRFDPNELITITVTRSAAQWQGIVAFLDTGPHNLVRGLIDAVLEAAAQHPSAAPVEPPPPDVVAPRKVPANKDAR